MARQENTSPMLFFSKKNNIDQTYNCPWNNLADCRHRGGTIEGPLKPLSPSQHYNIKGLLIGPSLYREKPVLGRQRMCWGEKSGIRELPCCNEGRIETGRFNYLFRNSIQGPHIYIYIFIYIYIYLRRLNLLDINYLLRNFIQCPNKYKFEGWAHLI